MEIICYACGRGENPENTIEAIEHCQTINSEWRIDIDLQLTKDKELVLFHDYNTLRRTGEDYNIFDLSLAEVKGLNAGYYFQKNNHYPFRRNPIEIPSLKEVFTKFPKAKYILDIHTNNHHAINKLIELVEASKLSNHVVIVSHYDTVIKDFKKKRPTWTFGAASKEAKKVVFSSILFLDGLFPLKSDVLLMPIKFKKIELLRNRIIKHVKNRKKKLIVWAYEGKTNDDVICIEKKSDYKKLKNKGVDAVYTAYPERFCKEIDVRNMEGM